MTVVSCVVPFYFEEEKAYNGFMGKSEEAEYLEYLRADGRMILKRVLKKKDKGVDWINLPVYKKVGASFEAVMNLRVPLNARGFFTAYGNVNSSTPWS
jgi:hypothetical protein